VARPATAEDVDGICGVCAATLRETYRGIYPPGEIEGMIAELYRPDLIRSEIGAVAAWWGWIVAEIGGAVTAAGAGGPSGPDVCELYTLCVDPQRQRGGLGTAVLDRFTLQARAAGVCIQRITVEPWNQQSVAFFQRHGFVERGRRPSDPAWGAADECIELERRI
jgi:ribosomal protein S18 acetylase RimI-like enzyme